MAFWKITEIFKLKILIFSDSTEYVETFTVNRGGFAQGG
jgi:hypothetical protein